MAKPQEPSRSPIEHYRQLLDHVRGRCSDNVWAALPREVAARSDAKRGPGTEESAIAQATRDSVSECGGSPPLFVSPDRSATPSNTPTPARPTRSAGPSSASPPRVRGKIWIDLDNTPHVPFFEPIIEELERRGYPLLVTARDAFQVIELAERRGLRCLKVGRHYGKHRLAKGYGLIYRALQMLPLVWRDRPVLAVSHGARSQLLVCNCLRIPSLLIEDYEHARFPWLTRPDWVLAPRPFPRTPCPSLRTASSTTPVSKRMCTPGS
ncbi:MAG: DUF354 domain-containing protein [Verrucomicrobia bacterium]|nr:DUF354 domain-containing protein [Verrucomicrobiota bacterium]